MSSVSQVATAGNASEQSVSYANYVLAVLVAAYILNYVDRLIISILLEPIKKDLGVSDTAMGLLSGFAFSVCYALSAIPIARYADKHNRRNVLALGIAVWSGMTALCGLTQNYMQLLFARLGVGLGEAAGVAPSHSLICDYFSPARRARAFGIYSAAIYLGIMCGLVLGGILTEMFNWRVAFIVVGLPGLLLALVVRFTVREPVRGQLDVTRSDLDLNLAEIIQFIRGQRSYLYVILGLSLVALTSNGFNVWVPALLGRVHSIGIAQIGISLGVLKGVCGVAGTLFGGWLADRLGRRDLRAHLVIPLVVNVLGAFLLAGFALLDDTTAALAVYALATVLLGMTFGPTFALAQNLVHVRMRALAAALLLATTMLIGNGLGPLLVGFLNDLMAQRFGAHAVRYSLALIAVANLLAGVCFWKGVRDVLGDLKKLQ